MPKQVLLVLAVLFGTSLFSQKKSSTKTLEEEKVISEEITYYKDSTTKASYILPNNAFTMLYRFGDENGTKDNYDSLKEVVHHVFRLNRYFGPRKKAGPSRLTCYVIVKEINPAEVRKIKKDIKDWNSHIADSLVQTNRAGFNFNRPWEIIFVKASDVKKGSVLKESKLSIVGSDGTLLASAPIKSFRYDGKKGAVKGKLLTERSGTKYPVIGAMVAMFKIDSLEDVQLQMDSVMTDAYGDFEMGVPDQHSNYVIVVKSYPKDVDNITLATQSGQEVAKLTRSGRGFEYKLIPADVIRLTEMEVIEDISLTFDKFKNKSDQELKVTENILYALGSFKLENSSKPVLDKVVKILKDNPKIKLEVISHTDAQGDDASNMSLSEKRSNSVVSYFVSKGIDKSRLKAIGKGEKEIRNRCGNDIDCTDKEHEYNRRTEFRFTKN
ncbi:MAG: OmpA family protein [Bacteroidia bacterium]|nr:OmpA family protein [Bacteroidia bacterium]